MPDPVPTPPAPVPVIQNGPFGWSLAFWTMLIGATSTTIVSIVLGIAGYVITGRVDENTKQLKENKDVQAAHAETQIAKQEEQIAAVKENTAVGESNVAATKRVETATQAIPIAAVEAAAKVVVEQKDAKAAESKTESSEQPGIEQ